MKFISLASSSKGNAYLLTAEGCKPLLLEAGIPIKQLREKLREHGTGITDLSGVLISHAHSDHSKAAQDLLKSGVDIWTGWETAEALGVEAHHRMYAMRYNLQVRIGGFEVLAFNLAHDVPCLGFLIAREADRLLFIPDTEYISNKFAGVTILAIECNHASDILTDNIQNHRVPTAVGQRVRRNHMDLQTVKDFIIANEMQKTLREVHLIHLSDLNSDEERFKREIQELVGRPVYVAA